MVGCWRCYLSGARCRLAYGPADASVKSRLVLPFRYRLTRVVPEKWPLNGCVCMPTLDHRRTVLPSTLITSAPQAREKDDCSNVYVNQPPTHRSHTIIVSAGASASPSYYCKLDARQSLALARPAMPLAACVRRPVCTTAAGVQRPTGTISPAVCYAIWRLQPKLKFLHSAKRNWLTWQFRPYQLRFVEHLWSI